MVITDWMVDVLADFGIQEFCSTLFILLIFARLHLDLNICILTNQQVETGGKLTGDICLKRCF